MSGQAQAVQDLPHQVGARRGGGGLDNEGPDGRRAVGKHGVLGDAQAPSAAVVFGEADSGGVVAVLFLVALDDGVAVETEGIQGHVCWVKGAPAGSALIGFTEGSVM